MISAEYSSDFLSPKNRWFGLFQSSVCLLHNYALTFRHKSRKNSPIKLKHDDIKIRVKYLSEAVTITDFSRKEKKCVFYRNT